MFQVFITLVAHRMKNNQYEIIYLIRMAINVFLYVFDKLSISAYAVIFVMLL